MLPSRHQLIGLLLLGGLSFGCSDGTAPTGPSDENPTPTGPQPFQPTANTTLTGEQAFTRVEIPQGVTVTATGDLVLDASESILIAGELVGDCVALELLGAAEVTITGTVSNACATLPAAEAAPGLTLVSTGEMRLEGATLESSGDAVVRTDPDLSKTDFPGAETVEGAHLIIEESTLRSLPDRAAPGAEGQTGADGAHGASWLLLSADGLQVDAESEIRAQDGGHGGDATFAGEVPADGPVRIRGGHGGRGGSVGLLAAGTLEVEDPAASATLAARTSDSMEGAVHPGVVARNNGARSQLRSGMGGDGGISVVDSEELALPEVKDVADLLATLPPRTPIVYEAGNAGDWAPTYTAGAVNIITRQPEEFAVPGIVFGAGLPGLDATLDAPAGAGGMVGIAGGDAPGIFFGDLPPLGDGQGGCLFSSGPDCLMSVVWDPPVITPFDFDAPPPPQREVVLILHDPSFPLDGFPVEPGLFHQIPGGEVNILVGPGGAGSPIFPDGGAGGEAHVQFGAPPPTFQLNLRDQPTLRLEPPSGAWGGVKLDGGWGGPGSDGCSEEPLISGGNGGPGGSLNLQRPGAGELWGDWRFTQEPGSLQGGHAGPGLPPGVPGAPGQVKVWDAANNRFVPVSPGPSVPLPQQGDLAGSCSLDALLEEFGGDYRVWAAFARGDLAHNPFVLDATTSNPRQYTFTARYFPERSSDGAPARTAPSGTSHPLIEMTVTAVPPIPALSGRWDSLTGEFALTGVGTVAGFPGVRVDFQGTLGPDVDPDTQPTLSGELTFGAGGKLPGGQSITYAIDGEKQ